MWIFHGIMCPSNADEMVNSVYPDQSAGSTLFAVTCLSQNLGSLLVNAEPRINYYTPSKLLAGVGGCILFSRCLSIRLSICVSIRPTVTFCFFLNILKRQLWKFIKLCRHFDIDEMYIYNSNNSNS